MSLVPSQCVVCFCYCVNLCTSNCCTSVCEAVSLHKLAFQQLAVKAVFEKLTSKMKQNYFLYRSLLWIPEERFHVVQNWPSFGEDYKDWSRQKEPVWDDKMIRIVLRCDVLHTICQHVFFFWRGMVGWLGALPKLLSSNLDWFYAVLSHLSNKLFPKVTVKWQK